MNTSHPFIPSKLNALLCASCYRDKSSHGDSVTCESCPNTGNLTNVNGIWLCSDCLSKELETSNSARPEGAEATPLSEFSSLKSETEIKKPELNEKFVTSAVGYFSNEVNKGSTELNQTERNAINELGQDAINSSEDFFNAQTIAFSDRWAEIVADDSISLEEKHYTFAKEIREFYLKVKTVLFTKNTEILEFTARQRASQVYLNQLASKLREEQRVKLHLANIDYVPPTPKSAPKSIRLNKDDKIASDYARIMGIPIETARRLISNKLKEVVGDCTCAETPGICKVHK